MTTSTDTHDSIRAVQWQGDHLRLLDQRLLPAQEHWIECRDAAQVTQAIRDLAVRGAPAIGIAAAWGVAMAAQQGVALEPVLAQLRAARPTAVNLMWALDRMKKRIAAGVDADGLLREARAIQDEDLAANRRMGELGASLISPGSGVLTHCNTGSLATAGYGTALGVIRAGVAANRIARVYAGETRPWQQGARLTMWELVREGIPARLIADSAAAHLMKSGAVQWVIVGADRIAANGEEIEIELRDPAELLSSGGRRVVVEGAQAWNPVFDVAPAELIDAIVTERGVIERPDTLSMQALFGS
jgi:methylthioribose-1-phosphate isomerase